ncbi:MAG: winged helix-turn-helix domain-containing protein [Nitrososphaerales archaeon]
MKNRSRVEILYDIIVSARGSAKKTHLMYKSNLSFKQLNLYLGFLLQNKLVEERFDVDDGTRTYFVTNRGLQFLELFENLQSYMGIVKSPEDELDALRFPRDGEANMIMPQAIS